jgi:hypothetical protein
MFMDVEVPNLASRLVSGISREAATNYIPTDAGYHHPSIYGAYLSGLVLFQKITGNEQAVAFENNQPLNPNANPCTLTN